ncbi:MAG: hypothetical protein A2X84_12525 [Desulfuromonadaceae bacterium GWC2_58_13]|nr:MAG: hypothetical protein A2X84_12525 [Desulfuromonadaceae bacterium GWC2_58_13]
MRAVILAFPFRRIVTMFGLTEGDVPAGTESPCDERAAAIGWAVRAAAARTPWQSTCLVQALAGMAMMHRRGIPGVIWLGVAKDAGTTESLAAHSWLSSSEAILTGAPAHERYTVISFFSWPGRSRGLSKTQ